MTLAEIEFVLMLRTESPNRGTSGRGAWARARRERDAASGAMARVLVHVLGRPLRTGPRGVHRVEISVERVA